MKEYSFGVHEGNEIKGFTLTNKSGMRVELISYGARIKDLFVPDRNGNLVDVCLGFNDMAGYINDTASFGATVGRVANRIRGAKFTLGGKEYSLAKNDGNNHLHGGINGYANRNFAGKLSDGGVVFTLLSPDMDEGYPGNVVLNVTYRLSEDNELSISYTAVTDKDTPLNLTNHAYFNLAGKGNIYAHELMINASRYTPNDRECIPTGEILKVKGTPMDFTTRKPIGQDIHSDFEQIKQFGGYDHSYLTDSGDAATVYEPTTGISMHVRTDLPAMQFYSGNMTRAKGKQEYNPHCALCLETQYTPNAINDTHLGGRILKRGETFESMTGYRFEVRG